MMHDRALAAVDLNLMVVLRALLTERHVTRAAARVGLSQSAASHALSRLRELYQDPLLVRAGRTLVLTPRAARLLPALERALGDLHGVVAGEPAFDPLTARRTFTIAVSDYLQALIMGPLLHRLDREAPGVDLTMVAFPNPGQLAESGAVDLVLSVPLPETRPLSEEPLFTEGFVCMVRRGHPRIRKKLTLAQYLAERHLVIAPTGTPGSMVDSLLEQRGLTRKTASRVTNFLVAPVVICETDLMNTMPARLARRLARTYPLRLLPVPFRLPTFDYAMFWHPRLAHDPAQAWLRALVARVCQAA